jgi:hypothetical protein
MGGMSNPKRKKTRGRKTAQDRMLPMFEGFAEPKAPRLFVLYLRLTAHERERFDAAARRADLPMSTWARHALLGCAPVRDNVREAGPRS